MARGREEVTPVGRVNFEEDTWNDDRLFLEKFLKERLYKGSLGLILAFNEHLHSSLTRPLSKG